MHLAFHIGQELRIGHISPVADGEVKIALGIELHSASKVNACTGILGDRCLEDRLLINKRHVLEPSPNDLRQSHVVFDVRKCEVNPPVRGEVGMQFDVEQSTLAFRKYRRDSAHRIGKQTSVLNHTQRARPLGHEQSAVGKRDQPPWVFQPVCNDFDLEIFLLRRDHFGTECRPCAEIK
jgi:hypothetical protein